MIKFCRSWILSIPPDAPGNFQISRSLITTSDINSAKWECKLTSDNFRVKPENMWSLYFWNGSCYFSYKLYSDTEMRSEIYSSPRISLTEEQNSFVTPVGAMKEFSDAFEEGEIVKMVIFVEIKLLMLLFLLRLDYSSLKPCKDYPDDIDSDFCFEFLKDGDFIFKCPDGNVPALKMVMNVTALKKYLNESNNDEFVLDHAVDVVKPIITYMHSNCFEMPKFYDLDYADRLIKAVKFFGLNDEINDIRQTYYFLLCDKFVKDPHNFEIILEWASLVSQHSIDILYVMVSTTIAHKYYYQWLERFPEMTEIAENQLLGEIWLDVTNIFAGSLSTKAILSLCNCVNCTK